MSAQDFKQKLEQLKYELTEKPKEMLTTQAKNRLLGLEDKVKNAKTPILSKSKTAGVNGIPVDLIFWDGKTNTYPMFINGGWERSIAYMNKYKNTNTHVRGLHCGLDMVCYAPMSEKIPIYATHNGIVTDIGTNGTNPVFLENGAIRTVYAHMYLKDILANKGDEISVGDVLGYMGSENAEGRHLHYEIQFNIPELAKIENTGEYSLPIFNNGRQWKSINVFTYEGAPTADGQALGRAIPDGSDLLLSNYTNYFRNATEIIQLGTEAYALLGGIYTVPRSEVLLNWLKNNGL